MVYDRAAIETPDAPDFIKEAVARGERSRIFTPVPVKLVIADDRLALLQLSTDEPGTPGVLLLHPSPLLQALTTLFEMIWERAIPYRPVGEEPTEPHTSLSTGERTVLSMLAAGLKDEAIARQSGVALSTIARRVRRILRKLGAETRFQAGIQANRRGWLD